MALFGAAAFILAYKAANFRMATARPSDADSGSAGTVLQVPRADG